MFYKCTKILEGKIYNTETGDCSAMTALKTNLEAAFSTGKNCGTNLCAKGTCFLGN
jgi:hypothetical protein